MLDADEFFEKFFIVLLFLWFSLIFFDFLSFFFFCIVSMNVYDSWGLMGENLAGQCHFIKRQSNGMAAVAGSMRLYVRRNQV